MVSEQVNKRKTIIFFKVFIISLIFVADAVGIYFALKYFLGDESTTNTNSLVSIEPNSTSEGEQQKMAEKIDFQPVVDEWIKSINYGNKSVIIYDLDRDEIAGEYNTDDTYNTASLYKLFVVYEGYRRIQSGEWDANNKAGSTGYTILRCLDLAIRESYSPCAETLWADIGHSLLDKIIEKDFDIHNSDISELTSNPIDIMKIMKIFYEHKEINDKRLLDTMKDSFLNQPETTYNWRQGLPSGFRKSFVYNKVGWDYNPDIKNWNIYHDAAIIENSDKTRHLIVVVMTNRVPFQMISKLGSMIEEKL